MIRQRAFTLVETLLASVLTAIVVGALVSLYSLVAARTIRAYSESSAVWQTSKVVDSMSDYIRNACDVSIVTINGASCLKCTMPDLGKYPNGNSKYDLYEPDSIIGLGAEKFVAGDRVWFYLGDTSGAPSPTGVVMHKAVRQDDLNPASSDLDLTWENYPGTTKPKYPLIAALTLAYDPTYRFATISVKATTVSFTDRQATSSTANANRYDITVTRRVIARNFR